MEPTIFKPGAYKTPGVCKGAGGIYKGRGVYNDGAGGGGESPDIPDEYKDQFKQVNYIQSNTSHVFINGISCKSSDLLKLNYYIMSAQDQTNNLFRMTTSSNNAGSVGYLLRINPRYYANQCNYQIQIGGSAITSKVYRYSIDNPIIGAYNLLVNVPSSYINDVQFNDNLSVGTDYSLVFIALLGFGTTYCKNVALGIIEILDKDSLQTKVKLVPCQNKNTGTYGFFDLQQSQFFGNHSGTDTLNEFIPS